MDNDEIYAFIILVMAPVMIVIAIFLGLFNRAYGAEVKFTAIGRPSMLRIAGRCPDLKFETLDSKGATYRLTGEVNLDSCDTGIGLRNKHMKEKYLETAKHPKANARIDVRYQGSDCTGVLTVHGKLAQVYNCEMDGKVLKFKTKISAHGIEVPSFAGVTVADEVQVEADLSK